MALIPPFFLDCVVAIGIDDEGEREWVASGFLYGHVAGKVNDQPNRRRIGLYLVTNRHVIEGQERLILRFNPIGQIPAREYTADLSANKCTLHPDEDIDLAIVRIDLATLRQDGIKFSYFRSDEHVLDKAGLESKGITEGDHGYVLGFPMGLIGTERNFVIARNGSIARIRDYLAGMDKQILMDCLIFPGNSGGPAVTQPEAVAIEGTQTQDAAYLFGIVSGYIPYQDVAISKQTRRPRVIFEENSGLASVVPAQYLLDLVQSVIPTSEATEELDDIHFKNNWSYDVRPRHWEETRFEQGPAEETQEDEKDE